MLAGSAATFRAAHAALRRAECAPLRTALAAEGAAGYGDDDANADGDGDGAALPFEAPGHIVLASVCNRACAPHAARVCQWLPGISISVAIDVRPYVTCSAGRSYTHYVHRTHYATRNTHCVLRTNYQALYSALGDAVGRPSLVVPLMPIQLVAGAVDCGLSEAAEATRPVARRALEECLAAVRIATTSRSPWF